MRCKYKHFVSALVIELIQWIKIATRCYNVTYSETIRGSPTSLMVSHYVVTQELN